MQSKTTIKYRFTAVRTTTIKKTTSSSFPSWKMAGEKAEKLIRRRKNLRQRRLILVAKLKRLRSAAEILSWSEELADTPNRLCIPERPCTKGSIQQLNPSWKEKEAEGSCYCHKTSWWWQECVHAKSLRAWLCDPMDRGPPGSSVHRILQARILEWVAIPFSRGSSCPRDWTHVSCIASRFFTIWDTREAQEWCFPSD